jgi:hypothetical protein
MVLGKLTNLQKNSCFSDLFTRKPHAAGHKKSNPAFKDQVASPILLKAKKRSNA